MGIPAVLASGFLRDKPTQVPFHSPPLERTGQICFFRGTKATQTGALPNPKPSHQTLQEAAWLKTMLVTSVCVETPSLPFTRPAQIFQNHTKRLPPKRSQDPDTGEVGEVKHKEMENSVPENIVHGCQ